MAAAAGVLVAPVRAAPAPMADAAEFARRRVAFGPWITIRPEAVPAGAVILIVQQAFEQDETDDVHPHISLVRAPAPACLEFTYDGPAGPVK